MSNSNVRKRSGARRARLWAPMALAAVAGLALLGGASTSTAAPKTKLILLAMPFSCGLNDYAKNTCAGARAAKLPSGYKLAIKTTIDYTNVPAFNSMLQTSLQLKPAGIVVFTNGPVAQTPILNKACAQGAKVIFYDTEGKGVKCDVSHMAVPATQIGVLAGKWLIAHPPKNGSKKVAIVSQALGQFKSNDDRVKGFKKTVEAKGFKVVTTIITTNDISQTRTGVTNALTAHPDLGAIFSANSPMGNGTQQALKGRKSIVQITSDGAKSDMAAVASGEVSANVGFSPFSGGKTGVEYMVKAIQGKRVPKRYFMAPTVVDKTNIKKYLKTGTR